MHRQYGVDDGGQRSVVGRTRDGEDRHAPAVHQSHTLFTYTQSQRYTQNR